MPKTISRRAVLVGAPVVVAVSFLTGLIAGRLGFLPSFLAGWRKVTMSDHDRTVAVVQRWAKMGQTKPRSSDLLVGLWSSNQALAFYPDACQILTGDIQAAFPERPGLAHGDLSVRDFNEAKNPAGRVKTVDDLATLVLESPAQ